MARSARVTVRFAIPGRSGKKEDGGKKKKKKKKKKKNNKYLSNLYIYQPLRSGRIWHKVNF